MALVKTIREKTESKQKQSSQKEKNSANQLQPTALVCLLGDFFRDHSIQFIPPAPSLG